MEFQRYFGGRWRESHSTRVLELERQLVPVLKVVEKAGLMPWAMLELDEKDLAILPAANPAIREGLLSGIPADLASRIKTALEVGGPQPLNQAILSHPSWPTGDSLPGCGVWLSLSGPHGWMAVGFHHRQEEGLAIARDVLVILKAGFHLGKFWSAPSPFSEETNASIPAIAHQQAASWLEAFESRPMRELCFLAKKVAKTHTAVLITGETGTGKEVLAQALHHWSPRAAQVLTSVNCAALKPELVESELFGHVRGAFTGAETARAGKFQASHQGTLLLDEIGELPMSIQPKFLRVLQEGKVEPLGGSQAEMVDVRVVAVTHRDLEEEVRKGTFREDLFYRLAVFPLRMPSLRERREDIPVLVDQLLKQWREEKLFPRVPEWTSVDCDWLQQARWPGNIRQLANHLKRALVLADGSLRLDLANLQPETVGTPPSGFRDLRPWNEIERDHLAGVLTECGGRLYGPQGAAARLGLHPETLRSRMRKLGLGSVKAFRKSHGLTPQKKPRADRL